MLALPRETNEYLYLNVTDNGTPVTSGVEATLTQNGARPTAWFTPDTVDGKPAVRIRDMQPGRYSVWVRITIGSEQPVEEAGTVTIT